MIYTRAELIFYVYMILMNIIGIMVMYLDKRKAKNKKWRISENSLIFIAIFGGSIGILFGMIFFKHKLNKSKFKYGVPFIYVIQKLVTIMITHMSFHIGLLENLIG